MGKEQYFFTEEEYDYCPADVKGPVLDIVMPCYNFGDYIAQAIESVLMQKCSFKYRLTIIEDASLDQSREIITEYYHKYRDRIALVLAHSNTKARILWFIRWKYCHADYCCTLEGDDYWTDPYKLEKQITFLRQYPEYVGVTGNVRNVNKDGSRQHVDYGLYPYNESHVYGQQEALDCILVSHLSAMVYRNYFREWTEERYLLWRNCQCNGDLRLSVELGMSGKIYFSNEVYGDHRRVFEGTSWTAKTRGKNLLLTQWNMRKELYRYVREVYGKDIPPGTKRIVYKNEAFRKWIMLPSRSNLRILLGIIHS